MLALDGALQFCPTSSSRQSIPPSTSRFHYSMLQTRKFASATCQSIFVLKTRFPQINLLRWEMRSMQWPVTLAHLVHLISMTRKKSATDSSVEIAQPNLRPLDGLSNTLACGERQNGPFRRGGVHGPHFSYETAWIGAIREITDPTDDHGHMTLFQTGTLLTVPIRMIATFLHHM